MTDGDRAGTAFAAAMKQQQRDLRARVMADSVVGYVLQEHGPIDERRPTREAHIIATKVAAMMFFRIYQDDAELGALRAENEHLRKMIETHTLAFAHQPVRLRP